MHTYIPFVLSFLMVTISSYLIASVFAPKKYGIGILYIFTIAFAQMVATVELLSLFSQINALGIFIINLIVFILSIIFFKKSGKPPYIPNFKRTIVKIFHALKKDKILAIMAVGFIFLISFLVFINAIMPINSYDALTYHLNRAAYWLFQGNLNHFLTPDERNLVMPINSEIMYTWVLAFLKNDWGLGFFSFAGYIMSVVSLWGILGLFGFCTRKKLWSVFIISSFASVIAEASSVETDIILAGLTLSAILFYLFSLEERKLSPIFFSALAYALAIGTKSPAVMALPGVLILMLIFSSKKMGKEGIKPIITFVCFLILNFILFAGYNYFLNFINYGNFLSSPTSYEYHRFYGGFKAYIANFIRYIFMMFDFSGFRYSEYVGQYILAFKFIILDLLHIPHNLGVILSDGNKINNGLIDVKMGAGILGFLLFLPGVIVSIIMGVVKPNSQKMSALLPFGLLFFINLLVLSGAVGYMVYSVRFLTYFILISSPVLVLTYYKKNPPVKLLVLFFVLSYMLLISRHITSRPFNTIVEIIKKSPSITDARETFRCGVFNGYLGKAAYCHIRDKIRTDLEKGSKIAIFGSEHDRIYPIKMLETQGYTIDTPLMEAVEDVDLSKYDYVLKINEVQFGSVIKKFKNGQIEYHIVGKRFEFPESIDPQCLYIRKDGQAILKNDKSVPTYWYCKSSGAFFIKKGFEPIQIITYSSKWREEARTVYFYKNTRK